MSDMRMAASWTASLEHPYLAYLLQGVGWGEREGHARPRPVDACSRCTSMCCCGGGAHMPRPGSCSTSGAAGGGVRCTPPWPAKAGARGVARTAPHREPAQPLSPVEVRPGIAYAHGALNSGLEQTDGAGAVADGGQARGGSNSSSSCCCHGTCCCPSCRATCMPCMHVW
jgi:hypothetical protein